ncbi:MAG TPA: DUF2062 domain-containing protein [Alphaproteobacteria bacterium]
MLFRRRAKKPFWLNVKHGIKPEKGWKRVAQYFIYRLKRRPGSPEFIAKGFAFGVAINYWPILFTHLIFGFLLCRVFRGDLLAMFIGTLLGNPWTFAIVYPLSYKLGKVFLGMRPMHSASTLDSAEEVFARIWPIESWESFVVAWHDIIVPMMIGGVLLALPSAFIAYFLTRNALRVYQGQRRKHLQRHFDDVEAEIEKTHLLPD